MTTSRVKSAERVLDVLEVQGVLDGAPECHRGHAGGRAQGEHVFADPGRLASRPQELRRRQGPTAVLAQGLEQLGVVALVVGVEGAGGDRHPEPGAGERRHIEAAQADVVGQRAVEIEEQALIGR